MTIALRSLISIVLLGCLVEASLAHSVHHDGMNTTQDMSLEWVYRTTESNQGFLTMTVGCPLTGWCAFGFGISMHDADTITCMADDANCFDGQVSDYVAPSTDAIQNIENVSVLATPEKRFFTFNRLLNTGDSLDRVLSIGEVPIIWAYNPIISTEMKMPHSTDARGQSVISIEPSSNGGSSEIALMNMKKEFNHSTEPSTYHTRRGMDISWMVMPERNQLLLILKCEKGSWCAVGFGKSMHDADTITCSLSGCVDGQASGHKKPARDEIHSITTHMETTQDSCVYTIVRFLNSTDKNDKDILDEKTYMIWAVGASYNTELIHTDFGQFSVNLFEEEKYFYAPFRDNYYLIFFGLFLVMLPFLWLPVIEKVLNAVCKSVFKQEFASPMFLARFFLKYNFYIVATIWCAGYLLFYFGQKDPNTFWYRALGDLAQFILGHLLVMPAASASLMWLGMGIPHERAVMYHGWLGFMFFIASMLHGALYVTSADFNFRVIWRDWGKMNPLAAFLSGISMTLLTVFSIPFVRRRVYHVFLMYHWMFAPLTVLFSVLHCPSTIYYVVPGFVLIATHYISQEVFVPTFEISRKELAKKDKFVKLVVCPRYTALSEEKDAKHNAPDVNNNNNNNSEKIVIDKHNKIQKRTTKHAIYPGMYIRLQIPKNYMQAHPLSVVDVDPETQEHTLVIKNMGSGTSTSMMTKLDVGTKVRVTRAMGKTEFELENYENVMLVGGGVGVTPLVAALFYFARNDRSSMATKKITAVWSVREPELIDMLEPEFLAVMKSLSSFLDLRIHYTGKDNTVNEALSHVIFRGRPNFPEIIAHIGETHKNIQNEPKSDDSSVTSNIGIFTCGPDPLIESVKTSAKEAPNNVIVDVHTETFLM